MGQPRRETDVEPAVTPAVPGGAARRRRWPWAVAGAAVLAAVAVVALRPAGETDTRNRAPAFAVPDLRQPHDTVRLTSFRGRPVVLNFWASRCVPCRRELPAFVDAHREFGRRINFVGMNNQDSRSNALKMADEFGIRYRSGYDPEGQVATAYGLVDMPATIFIDARGRIVEHHRGEISGSGLVKAVNRLLDPDASDESGSRSATTTTRYLDAHRGLCAAAAAAARNDVPGANEIFFARAHQAIHELAAAAGSTDRAAAARLLEAKQTVEAQLRTEATPKLAADIRRLADALASALDAVSGAPPTPCE